MNYLENYNSHIKLIGAYWLIQQINMVGRLKTNNVWLSMANF